MSTVDRRPTVARNFIAGDRRSIEWALEHWMGVRPPVTHVTLDGEPAFVTATAQGLHDLGVLHGLPGAPFSVEVGLPAEEPARDAHTEVLARACGARVLATGELGEHDVVIAVDVDGMDAARRDRLIAFISLRKGHSVIVQRVDVPVHSALRPVLGLPNVHLVPASLDALLLVPQWEAVVEDCAPARLCVVGSGMRLFGAAVACGDFFLERLAQVPDRKEARGVVRDQTAIIGDLCAIPVRWTSTTAVWRSLAERAGARIVTTGGAMEGVVITPEQRVANAA